MFDNLDQFLYACTITKSMCHWPQVYQSRPSKSAVTKKSNPYLSWPSIHSTLPFFTNHVILYTCVWVGPISQDFIERLLFLFSCDLSQKETYPNIFLEISFLLCRNSIIRFLKSRISSNFQGYLSQHLINCFSTRSQSQTGQLIRKLIRDRIIQYIYSVTVVGINQPGSEIDAKHLGGGNIIFFLLKTPGVPALQVRIIPRSSWEKAG